MTCRTASGTLTRKHSGHAPDVYSHTERCHASGQNVPTAGFYWLPGRDSNPRPNRLLKNSSLKGTLGASPKGEA